MKILQYYMRKLMCNKYSNYYMYNAKTLQNFIAKKRQCERTSGFKKKTLYTNFIGRKNRKYGFRPWHLSSQMSQDIFHQKCPCIWHMLSPICYMTHQKCASIWHMLSPISHQKCASIWHMLSPISQDITFCYVARHGMFLFLYVESKKVL